MADSIKGKDYKKYEGNLRKGILLHRKIDSYTDAHPLVQQSAHRLFDHYRHYNGVIVDVFYDHFLAKNWRYYSSTHLAEYVQDFYALLEENLDRVPENIRYMYPHMSRENWLYNYRKIDGIAQILYQMNNRIKGDFEIHHSVENLRLHYAEYEAEFTKFFPQIQEYVECVKSQLRIEE